MTEKELRKLSRAELLEMLISQSIELQDCKEKLNAAETALKDREIAINEAGSIAEAALALNGIFDAAQASCQQYIENISRRSARQEALCAELETQSQAKAQRIVAEAEQERARMELETKEKCAAMLTKAETDSQQYWLNVSAKLQDFYDAHAGLRELLAFVTPREKQDKTV